MHVTGEVPQEGTPSQCAGFRMIVFGRSLAVWPILASTATSPLPCSKRSIRHQSTAPAMASKRKLSTAAFGFEDDEERAKRISHRVASEKRSKDSEEGYRPQSPKMPDPDGEVKHALAGALEQKIWWQGGGWLPPGMDVHLAEAEKEEVSRKTTKGQYALTEAIREWGQHADLTRLQQQCPGISQEEALDSAEGGSRR